MDQTPANHSLAYMLGRRAAPLFLKTDWIIKSLAGPEEDRLAAEIQMGTLLAQAYEQTVPSFKNNRLSGIAAKLTRCLTNKNRQHSFKLDQSGELNACALPGGFIYMSEPLFDLCGEDSDAAAFVLAHEIAHGIYGDAAAKLLTRSAVNGLFRFRTRGLSPPLRQLFAQLIEQGYSREKEFRADRFAAALTQAAGFDPLGGARLFAELAQREDDSTFGSYFSSHPSFKERIKHIKEKIG